MKKLVAILATAVAGIATVACHRKVGDTPCPDGASYYSKRSNGVLVEGCTDESGAKHGPFLSTYEHGKPMASGTCVHGAPDGQWMMYNAGDGSPRNMATYADGQANGPAATYGSSPVEGTCKNGKPDGEWTQGGRRGVYREGELVAGEDIRPHACSTFDGHCGP